MEKHVTVAGAMHLAVAAIGLIAIPIVLLALNGSGLAAFLAGEPAVLAVYTLWVLLKSDSRSAV